MAYSVKVGSCSELCKCKTVHIKLENVRIVEAKENEGSHRHDYGILCKLEKQMENELMKLSGRHGHNYRILCNNR